MNPHRVYSLILGAVLLAGCSTQKMSEGTTDAPVFTTVSGSTVCLPTLNTNMPNEDCAMALQTDAGKVYLLNTLILETDELFKNPLVAKERIHVSGSLHTGNYTGTSAAIHGELWVTGITRSQ